MTTLAVYGLPILAGFICGYFLTVQANIVLSVGALAVSGWMLWTTKDAELGSLIGVIAAMIAGAFLLALWVTVAFVSGPSINFGWLLR